MAGHDFLVWYNRGIMKLGLIDKNYRQKSALRSAKGPNASSSSYMSEVPKNNLSQIVDKTISFQGLNTGKVASAAGSLAGVSKGFKKPANQDIVIENFSAFKRQLDGYIGKDFVSGFIEDFTKLKGDETSKFIEIKNDSLTIHEKNLAGKILRGLSDVAKLPIDILGASVNGLQKIPFIKDAAAVKNLSNLSILQKRNAEKQSMELFYKIKGFAEYKDDPFALRSKILNIPAGKPVGNYNTKDERALNRLGTGFVSSLFVGMDFYNLTMYKKKKKKEAKKTERKRRYRELSRIGINALMSYSILGAFSSYINKNKNLACAAIAGSALFAEITTRLITGTPLTPLSPEGAKKYNEKLAQRKQNGFFGLFRKNKAENLNTQQKADKNVSTQGVLGNINNKTNKSSINNLQNTNKGQILQTSVKNSESEGNSKIPSLRQNSPIMPQQQAFAAQNQISAQKNTAGAILGQSGSSLSNAFLNDESKNVFKPFKPSFGIQNTIESTILADNEYKSKEDIQPKTLSSQETDDKKSPVTLKKVGLAALAALAVDIAYYLLMQRKGGFNNAVVKFNDSIIAGYKKLTKKDLIVEDNDLRKFLEGFNDSRMGSIKDAYARIMDVKFTKAEAEELLKASKDGIIHIDKNNKIFNGAYERSARESIERRISNIEGFSRTENINNEINYTINKNLDGQIRQKFSTIDFKIDLNSPKSSGDGEYYTMNDAVFNFGNIKNRKRKVLIDAITYPFNAIKNLIKLPSKPIKSLLVKKEEKVKNPYEVPDLGELYRDCSVMFQKYKNGKIDKAKFSDYLINDVNTKVLNTDTTPSYPQSSLASISRTLVTLISSYFFINDFRNEVLIQSNGKNTQKAAEVTKERTAHKVSNFVLNQFFMNLFNHTFEKAHLGSLAGATLVAAATEVTNESSVRASIGVPLRRMESKEAINEHERKHIEKKGPIGAYYRFMARITGKKMLSEKAENKK